MATATKTAPVFYRHSYTERLIFPGKPDRATRAALRASGWRWNIGGYWWRNQGATAPIKARELAALLAPVAALEAGNLPPWRKPWVGGDAFLPLRHAGQPYRGINTLILWIESDAKGYASPYWLTFKQALEYGGAVRKGEKSTAILWCEPITKKDTAEDGSEREDRFWISKVYRVFNASQCDGLPERFTDKPAQQLDPAQRLEQADAFIANTKADIRHGSGAFYRPSDDSITLPAFEAFTSPEGYYGTACHELAHWTGHGSRLNRDMKGFGHREAYAQEEITAELAACFTCASLGIAPADMGEHAAYLDFWVKALKSDPRYIFQAASKAQAACDFLQNLQPKETP